MQVGQGPQAAREQQGTLEIQGLQVLGLEDSLIKAVLVSLGIVQITFAAEFLGWRVPVMQDILCTAVQPCVSAGLEGATGQKGTTGGIGTTGGTGATGRTGSTGGTGSMGGTGTTGGTGETGGTGVRNHAASLDQIRT